MSSGFRKIIKELEIESECIYISLKNATLGESS